MLKGCGGSQVCVAPAGERGTRIWHFSFHQLLQLWTIGALCLVWTDSQANVVFSAAVCPSGAPLFLTGWEELGTNGLLIRETKKSIIFVNMDFPGDSAGKESACNAGDLVSVPGLGRSPGEGNGYPVFWPGEFHGLYSPWGHKELDTTEWLSLSLFTLSTYEKQPGIEIDD